MDDNDAKYAIENEQQYWIDLDSIVAAECDTHESIDNALRAYLEVTTIHKKEYIQTEFNVARCCEKLLNSAIYQKNEDYVRRQFLYCLLQEDDINTLHIAAALLLFDGRSNERAFEMMQDEGAFPRLVQLIRAGPDNGRELHRLLIELMFEMSRIQKLTLDDLTLVDDNFILHLFQLIEELSDDAHDPYHYPIIRVLLVLNEQYMCFASDTVPPLGSHLQLTNRILKLLSMHGPSYRTFGENLILLLNRETELGPQLLILKLLYLLFTTPATYEYFYTNDLHVLVDVIIRNLLDLDPGNDDLGHTSDGLERGGQRALRHTYLRVLCPLLKNTQLARRGSNYKREEVRKLMYLLVNHPSAHFAPVDETVIRLVLRCKQIDWIKGEGDDEQDEMIRRKLDVARPQESDVARNLIGMSLTEAGVSSLSVSEMSAKVTKDKPNVPAPRRNRKLGTIQGKMVHINGTDTNHGGIKIAGSDISPQSISGFGVRLHHSGARSHFITERDET